SVLNMSNTFMKATAFQVRWMRANSNILKRMETERSVYNSQWREDIFLTCLHAIFIYYINKIPLPRLRFSAMSGEVFPRLRFSAMSGEVFPRLRFFAMSGERCFPVCVFARCRERAVSPSSFLRDVGRELLSPITAHQKLYSSSYKIL